jgi:general secretion pathway protein K
MTPKSQETGAALLTVLMLVAVIGVIAVASLERLRLSTRLTTNIAATDQARAYGYAAETLARTRIADLRAQDSGQQSRASWLGRDLPFPIDGGTATARLGDGGNCFNLNSLVIGNPDTGYAARPTGIAQFEALMTLIGVAAGTAQNIALASADWIDSDAVPQPGGAEDGSYAGFRTPNTLMADPSELKTVAGVTPELYARIRPWVCVLPDVTLSPINVNTLSAAQAPLIAMMIPGKLSLKAAKQMIDDRPIDGYATSVNFWSLPALAGVTPSPEVLSQPQRITRWFALDLTVELAGTDLRETALIDGGPSPAKLIRRRYGDQP